MTLNAHLPLNNLSFGFCSFNILKELYQKGISPNLFTQGGVDLSAFNLDQDFQYFLQSCLNKAPKYFNRNNKCFKLWHINGSEQSISNDTYLFTFYELDNPTQIELNILNNQKAVFVSSKETKTVFENFDVQIPVIYCPLGFDKHHFKKEDVRPYGKDIIVFGVFGKFEKRKHHAKLIQTWLKNSEIIESMFFTLIFITPF